MSFKLSWFSGLLLAVGASAAHAQLYTVTDLGVLSGQFPASTATGINTAGQVTGYSSGRIFVTDAATHKLIDLGSGQGLGINAKGQVTGQVISTTAPGGDAFITDPATNAIIDLGTLVCAPGIRCPGYSAGTAVNDSGQVTGYSALESSAAGPRAFLTDATTHAMVNLADACGCQSEGLGINASGQVTGWMRVASGDQHAFIADPVTHNMTDLGTAGGRNSTGRGINVYGQMTGVADGPVGPTAFFFTNGSMEPVGYLGGNGSEGNAVNASGQVVGSSLTPSGASHAFFYSGNATIDLNTAIGPAADLYTLNAAVGINDRGQIAANGVEKGTGLSVAFLLTPVVSTAPTASIAVLPTTISPGDPARVTWFSTGATSCTPSGIWASDLNGFVSGAITVLPSKTGTYVLGVSCSGPGGTATATTVLTVIAAPTLSLSANDIPAGSSVQISWTGFPGATSCSGSWAGQLPVSGSQTVGPFNHGAGFELTCFAPGVTLSPPDQFLTVYTPNQVAPESVVLSHPNVYALALPGEIPGGGGLGSGYAFNGRALPYPLTVLGETFEIGNQSLSVPTGAARQTIALSGDRLDHLTFIATGVNGNQPNQPFVVTYGDGSTSTFVQSVSDWHTPQNYAGETLAVAAGSRVTPTGATQPGVFDLYAYRVSLDGTKLAVSLTLPATRNVILLGLNETLARRNAALPLSALFNVSAMASVGQAPAKGGLAQGYALEADLLPSPLVWSGQQFSIGAANQPDAVANATIPLAGALANSLTLLATGVNGNQPDMAFLVTYQDGTTTLFRQSVSDWHTPQGYAGEALALSTGFRITPSGARQAGPWNVYAYTFPTDPNKAIASLTLPKTRNVVVLAVNALAQ